MDFFQILKATTTEPKWKVKIVTYCTKKKNPIRQPNLLINMLQPTMQLDYLARPNTPRRHIHTTDKKK
jgi:hypothetical protein